MFIVNDSDETIWARREESKLKSTQPHSAKAGATLLTNDLLSRVRRGSSCNLVRNLYPIISDTQSPHRPSPQLSSDPLFAVHRTKSLLLIHATLTDQIIWGQKLAHKKLVVHCSSRFSSSVFASFFPANPGSVANVIQFSYFLFVSRAANNAAPVES